MKNSTKPNFDMIKSTFLHRAYEAYAIKDAARIMILIDSKKHASFLEDNIHSFLDIGIYEEALFIAMIGGCHCHPECWSDLIAYADLEKLRSIGDPIPTKPVTVYRGVAYIDGVVDRSGKIYCDGDEELDELGDTCELGDFLWGYSWTLNKHTAAWFSNRLPNRTKNLSGKGAVFYAKIKPEDILFYSNRRGEEEVVVDKFKLPDYLRALKVMPEPIKPKSVDCDKL